MTHCPFWIINEMNEKLILLLTDDEIILYKGLTTHTYRLAEGIDPLQDRLKNLISLTPKIPLCLMIDRNQQDMREEQLPPLMPWDRLRLLSHKQEEWTTQGKFHGYRFFKQGGQSFLQWVNITQNDPLMPWLLWIKSLENPLEGVFFVSLEAGRFLKKHFPSSPHYHLLIYKISHKMRYVLFKDRRLLLCRPFSGEEDIRSSLHFLSRLYPDIYEKLHILSLVEKISLTFPHVMTLADPHAFMDFLISQKRGTLSLNVTFSSQDLWIRRGIGFVLMGSLVLTGLSVYQGLQDTQETETLLSKIEVLKGQIRNRKVLLNNKNIPQLRSALDHYNHLKPQIRSPLKSLERLGLALEKHHLRLQSLLWEEAPSVSLEISFMMQNREQDVLDDHFKAVLSALGKGFPNSHIRVIEGPFKSGSHETFEYPPGLAAPTAHVRITGL
jgi:hypothetical protein